MGCASSNTAGSRVGSFSKSNSEKKPDGRITVTPETALSGSVVRVNELPRFVVLNFAVGSLPGLGTPLNVYRHGLKTGMVKVTGPQLDDNIIADVIDGSAQAGDGVRGD